MHRKWGCERDAKEHHEFYIFNRLCYPYQKVCVTLHDTTPSSPLCTNSQLNKLNKRIMALWFECKVKFDKMQENGSVKKVNEPYLVDALSFTEAEARIIEMITPYISGEFTISAVKKTKISEIFWNESGDRFYMVKVMFITLDEKTAVEKKSASFILVQASDFKNALDTFEKGMNGTMADYEIASITETPLMEVFPINAKAEAEAGNSEN